MTDENMLKTMMRDVRNFHGTICTGGAIGARIALVATKKLGSLKERDVKVLVGARACIADAVQAICGATNKRFRMAPDDEHIVTFFKGKMQLRFVVTTKKKYRTVDEVFAASDHELFDVVEENEIEEPMQFRR
jgi:formylmethanofuran dehydrogenase subunit E